MYQVNIKIQRKAGVKATPEVYLVEAVSLTDIETILYEEFKDNVFEVVLCKLVHFVDIFENISGSFFKIDIVVEDLESKTSKELYLQEAENDSNARELFRNSVPYGEIVGINLTNIKGIIRPKK